MVANCNNFQVLTNSTAKFYKKHIGVINYGCFLELMWMH